MLPVAMMMTATTIRVVLGVPCVKIETIKSTTPLLKNAFSENVLVEHFSFATLRRVNIVA